MDEERLKDALRKAYARAIDAEEREKELQERVEKLEAYLAQAVEIARAEREKNVNAEASNTQVHASGPASDTAALERDIANLRKLYNDERERAEKLEFANCTLTFEQQSLEERVKEEASRLNARVSALEEDLASATQQKEAAEAAFEEYKSGAAAKEKELAEERSRADDATSKATDLQARVERLDAHLQKAIEIARTATETAQREREKAARASKSLSVNMSEMADPKIVDELSERVEDLEGQLKKAQLDRDRSRAQLEAVEAELEGAEGRRHAAVEAERAACRQRVEELEAALKAVGGQGEGDLSAANASLMEATRSLRARNEALQAQLAEMEERSESERQERRKFARQTRMSMSIAPKDSDTGNEALLLKKVDELIEVGGIMEEEAARSRAVLQQAVDTLVAVEALQNPALGTLEQYCTTVTMGVKNLAEMAAAGSAKGVATDESATARDEMTDFVRSGGALVEQASDLYQHVALYVSATEGVSSDTPLHMYLVTHVLPKPKKKDWTYTPRMLVVCEKKQKIYLIDAASAKPKTVASFAFEDVEALTTIKRQQCVLKISLFNGKSILLDCVRFSAFRDVMEILVTSITTARQVKSTLPRLIIAHASSIAAKRVVAQAPTTRVIDDQKFSDLLVPALTDLAAMGVSEEDMGAGTVDMLAVMDHCRAKHPALLSYVARKRMSNQGEKLCPVSFELPQENSQQSVTKSLKIDPSATVEQVMAMLRVRMRWTEVQMSQLILRTKGGFILDPSATLLHYGLGCLFLSWRLVLTPADPSVPAYEVLMEPGRRLRIVQEKVQSLKKQLEGSEKMTGIFKPGSKEGANIREHIVKLKADLQGAQRVLDVLTSMANPEEVPTKDGGKVADSQGRCTSFKTLAALKEENIPVSVVLPSSPCFMGQTKASTWVKGTFTPADLIEKVVFLKPKEKDITALMFRLVTPEGLPVQGGYDLIARGLNRQGYTLHLVQRTAKELHEEQARIDMEAKMKEETARRAKMQEDARKKMLAEKQARDQQKLEEQKRLEEKRRAEEARLEQEARAREQRLAQEHAQAAQTLEAQRRAQAEALEAKRRAQEAALAEEQRRQQEELERKRQEREAEIERELREKEARIAKEEAEREAMRAKREEERIAAQKEAERALQAKREREEREAREAREQAEREMEEARLAKEREMEAALKAKQEALAAEEARAREEREARERAAVEEEKRRAAEREEQAKAAERKAAEEAAEKERIRQEEERARIEEEKRRVAEARRQAEAEEFEKMQRILAQEEEARRRELAAQLEAERQRQQDDLQKAAAASAEAAEKMRQEIANWEAQRRKELDAQIEAEEQARKEELQKKMKEEEERAAALRASEEALRKREEEERARIVEAANMRAEAAEAAAAKAAEDLAQVDAEATAAVKRATDAMLKLKEEKEKAEAARAALQQQLEEQQERQARLDRKLAKAVDEARAAETRSVALAEAEGRRAEELASLEGRLGDVQRAEVEAKRQALALEKELAAAKTKLEQMSPPPNDEDSLEESKWRLGAKAREEVEALIESLANAPTIPPPPPAPPLPPALPAQQPSGSTSPRKSSPRVVSTTFAAGDLQQALSASKGNLKKTSGPRTSQVPRAADDLMGFFLSNMQNKFSSSLVCDVEGAQNADAVDEEWDEETEWV